MKTPLQLGPMSEQWVAGQRRSSGHTVDILVGWAGVLILLYERRETSLDQESCTVISLIIFFPHFPYFLDPYCKWSGFSGSLFLFTLYACILLLSAKLFSIFSCALGFFLSLCSTFLIHLLNIQSNIPCPIEMLNLATIACTFICLF